MAGRKPIEKRLMNIEDGISNLMDKLCQMSPCEPEDSENNIEEASED